MPRSNSHYFNIGGVPEHFNIPIKKAIDEGVYSLKNIELYWKDYKGGTGDLVKSLANDEIDIGILLTEGAIKAISDGHKFKIIQIYVNSPLTWGVYVDNSSTLCTEKDVKNPNFCISRFGSGSHLMAFLLAQREQWEIKKLHFDVIDNFIGALKFMPQHPDNLFLWEIFMTKPYVDSDTLKKISTIPTPWPSFSIVVREDFIDNNPDVLYQFLLTTANYTYKFKQNALESIEYLANYFDFSIEDMKVWLSMTDWNYVLDPPQQKIHNAIEFLKEFNLISKDISKDNVCIPQTFWDNFPLS